MCMITIKASVKFKFVLSSRGSSVIPAISKRRATVTWHWRHEHYLSLPALAESQLSQVSGHNCTTTSRNTINPNLSTLHLSFGVTNRIRTLISARSVNFVPHPVCSVTRVTFGTLFALLGQKSVPKVDRRRCPVLRHP